MLVTWLNGLGGSLYISIYVMIVAGMILLTPSLPDAGNQGQAAGLAAAAFTTAKRKARDARRPSSRSGASRPRSGVSNPASSSTSRIARKRASWSP